MQKLSLIFILGMLIGAGGAYILASDGNMPLPVKTISDTEVYNQGYVGGLNGSVHYDVMVVDNLSTQFVMNSLQYVPNWVEFTIIPINTSEYEIETEGEFTGMHMPTRDNLIVMFDGDKYNMYKIAGAAYIGTGNGHRIGVAVYDSDDAPTVGMRTFHEVLHSEERGGEADDMASNIGYTVFSNEFVFQHFKYYNYLMIKYRGDFYGN